MRNSDKIKYILRKYPETKFNRADFFWKYLEEFYEVKFYITKPQFKAFWQDFSGVERKLRDILKEEPEFKLPAEQDAQRYSKSSDFRLKYAK